MYGIGLGHLRHEFGSEEFSAAGTGEQVLYILWTAVQAAQMVAHCNLGLKVSDNEGAPGSS